MAKNYTDETVTEEPKKAKKNKAPEVQAEAPKKAKKDKAAKSSSSSNYEDEFKDPSSGDQFSNAEHLGALVLFSLTEVDSIITAASKDPVEVVKGSVAVLTKNNGKALAIADVLEYEETLVFGKSLVSSLRSSVGKNRVLGVMAQGTAKPAQSPPWILTKPTDEQKDLARAYLKTKDPFSS